MTAKIYHAVNPGLYPLILTEETMIPEYFLCLSRPLIALWRKIRDIDTAKDTREM